MLAKPVIAYPGAKWKAWEIVEPLIPTDIEDWREPFLGGGSTSLLMAASSRYNLKRMLVGDLAPEVWAFWRGVQENATAVAELATKWFNDTCPTHEQLQAEMPGTQTYQRVYEAAIEEAKEMWDFVKNMDCSKASLEERAARFFLINKISFSALGDSGSLSKDRFVAFNTAQTNNMIDAQPLLKKMEILNVSFEETMANVDKNKTFIFLDPPYYNQEKSGLYGKDGDTHKGFPHKELSALLHKTNCRWLMTYDDSVYVRRMYQDRNIVPFKLKYTMSLTASEDALCGEEIFVANYPIEEDTDESLYAML